MLAVISPAKKLDFETVLPGLAPTTPRLTDDTAALAARARTLKRAEIARLMDLSEALTELNFQRYQALSDRPEAAATRPAALAFAGDTYIGLDAPSLSSDDLTHAQDHLRILSGLYGLLRPLDRIQPYRLEMGTRLDTPRGPDLYAFWGERLARMLDEDLAGHASPIVVNLASQEYFRAVDAKALRAPVLSCVFKEERGGTAKVISFAAKRARGAMARFMIVNRIDRPEGLKDFTTDGYRFRAEQSDDASYVFTRAAG
jgi:cytoplasmic iron level regulating protein YaaA (DUF328/UPF0246 family)